MLEAVCLRLVRLFATAAFLSELFQSKSMGATFRWVVGSNQIVVENGGIALLSDIKSALPSAPLSLVDPNNGVWLLSADLRVTQGSTLVLHGKSVGGDVNELRLLSNNTGATNSVVSITSDYGNLDIKATKITSWDETAMEPDTETASYGRAYIRVRSSLAPDGVTPQESRMDIADSEICYLGSGGSEAYGLVWKVVGADPNPGRNLLAEVRVYGSVVNSHLHDNYFGGYTFGASGMQWLNNEVDNNTAYGVSLHNHSVGLLVSGNRIHHNGNHGLFAADGSDQLTIINNRSWSNAQNGILLYRSGNGALIANNFCTGNANDGLALTAGFTNVVRDNVLTGNQRAGLRLDLGSAGNQLQGNSCSSNGLFGIYVYQGADVPQPGDDGRPKRNHFAGNFVESNVSDGINVVDSDDNVFESNVLSGNGGSVHLVRSFRNRLNGNSIPAGVIVKTFGDTTNVSVTYLSNQPLVRVQVDPFSSAVFDDTGGQIFDPEEKHGATTVTSDGSRLALTTVEVGTTASTVAARSLWVRVPDGTILVNPTLWTNNPAIARQWISQASQATQSFSCTVGELTPNQGYVIHKSGQVLTSGYADAAGIMHFFDVIGSVNPILYSLEPVPQVSVKRMTDGFLISWTAGKLQHATTLSPPNWQDVPVSPNQVSVIISFPEPMDFFRVTLVGGESP